MHARHLCLLAPLALALHACSSDDGHDFAATDAARAARLANDPPTAVVFDPAAGAAGLPFPNDVAFAGTLDGTLNITVTSEEENPTPEQNAAAAADLSDPRVALNQMDGFSTTAPITAPVTNALDPASLRVGETIRVFELELDAAGDPVALGDELGADRLVAVERDRVLALLPLAPLAPATGHAVYVLSGTDGVKGTDGTPIATSSAFRFARGASPLVGNPAPGADAALVEFNPALPALEPLRQLTRPLIELIQGADNPPAVPDIALAWRFTTQGIREVLQAAADASVAKPMRVATNGATTSAVPGGRGLADLYVGALDVPYYQVAADGPTDFLAALNGFWVPASGAGEVVTRYDPAPLNRGDQTIPVLMSVPNATSGQTVPDAGWPVMIFQHGIVRDRTNMLAVADAMAAAGFVVVAIDLPLHGITDPDGPFRADDRGLNPFVARERTFDIDVLTIDAAGNATPGPDGEIDPTGRHFYNLQNLANSRDNLRQAISDLLTLSKSLDGLQVLGADGTPGPFPIDATRKAFLGHSLGGIVGTTFLSYDDTVQSATLAMPGGGIAQLLAASPSFGPPILAGVTAANGGELSAAAYQRFLSIAQTLVDSGDAINHARFVREANASVVHLIEVVGEEGVSLPDQVIPNAVLGAPLAGTEPLAVELFGVPLPAVTESATGNALVRFVRGTHGSILVPQPGPRPDGAEPTAADAAADAATARAVTAEMQTQAATFAASGGQTLPIGNAALIAPSDVVIQQATLPEAPDPDAPDASAARP